MQNQLEEVSKEKKEKFYEFKNSGNTNGKPIATNNNGETQGKYPDGTAVMLLKCKTFEVQRLMT